MLRKLWFIDQRSHRIGMLTNKMFVARCRLVVTRCCGSGVAKMNIARINKQVTETLHGHTPASTVPT